MDEPTIKDDQLVMCDECGNDRLIPIDSRHAFCTECDHDQTFPGDVDWESRGFVFDS